MLREYSVEHYLGLIEKMRKANPEMVITSDIIAGFPNETEEEHQDTLKLLRAAQFDFVYAYAYSSRKGTKAARMDDVITDDIRGRRLREVMDVQEEVQEAIRKKMEGRTYQMLVVEKGSFKGQTKWTGRTSCNRLVHFDPPETEKDYLWHWVDVEITSATAFSCQGVLKTVHGKRPPQHA
jgi:tRNA-2-methylthio-N6-dimethylallyladenosine synthase